MTGHLYILSGASGCGKTTLLNNILASGGEIARANKYSERARRNDQDDIIHVDTIDVRYHDLAYVINNNYYGLKTSEIEEQLDQGLSVFIILSDFRVIARLKQRFPERASAVYVSSAMDPDELMRVHGLRHKFEPSLDRQRSLQAQFFRLKSAARLGQWTTVFESMSDLVAEWKGVIPDAQSAEIRAQKIKLFHNRYADHITLFDHVILNYTRGNPDEMTAQMLGIMRSHRTASLRVRPKATPPVYIIAAASGAGKGLLMETLDRIIGDSRVAIVTKVATREAKGNDRRDGMRAIGRDGVIPDEFDIRWRFHDSGTGYAIRSQEIRENIEIGKAQAFVSNMQAFPKFRELLGSHAVFVYLHSLRPQEAVREYQMSRWDRETAEARLREIREVHDDYISHIGEFDHVLLNTTFPEDLFDQMLGLVDHYEKTQLAVRL